MTRGGRPPKYVRGRDGKPVVALSREPKSRRYYATGTKPRHYFGTDLDQALVRFRSWQAKQQGSTVAMFVGQIDEETDKPPVWSYDFLRDGWQHELTGPAADAIFAWVREQVLRDPARFAERIGIPELARLSSLPEPEPSLTLQAMGSAYFGKRRKVSKDWRKKMSGFWHEFVAAVGVITLGQIKREHVEAYHARVWDRANKDKLAPTYLAHRFQAVRSVLRFGLKNGRDVANVRRIIDLTALFELPKKTGVQPDPMSPRDFRKLLDAADTKMRAILLLSLNCALYPGEAATVRKSDIDLEAGTYSAARPKTGIARIGVLWPRTVEAIREYQKAEPHHSAYLFVSNEGGPYAAHGLAHAYRRLRVKVGVTAEFAGIRDGAFTEAVKAGLDEARWLARHKAGGASDNYIRRDPSLVREACAAIERTYFGGKA